MTGLILIGILFGLAVAELAARLLPLPNSRSQTFFSDDELFVCSPTLGWSGRPHYEGLYAREDFSHVIRFNSLGMYDTEHPLEPKDNTFRILWVGDSYAQALQVEEEQTAHQQLENLLNERLGTPELSFEVINTAMMGWGTGQQLIHYREVGHSYEPDLVILLFFVGNDLQDALPGEAFTLDNWNCFAPYFPVCSNGAVSLEPWSYVPGLDPAWNSCSPAYKWLTSGLSWVQRHSHLFAQLEPLLLSLKPRRLYGREFGFSFGALYLPEENEEVKYGWLVTEGLLSQFNQEAQAHGTNFGVVLVPPREVVRIAQFNESQLQGFYQSDPAFKEADINQPNRRLVNFLQSQNVPVFDLQQPMTDYISQTGAQLYMSTDWHWSVEGNRMAAESIFNWLMENNLLVYGP